MEVEWASPERCVADAGNDNDSLFLARGSRCGSNTYSVYQLSSPPRPSSNIVSTYDALSSGVMVPEPSMLIAHASASRTSRGIALEDLCPVSLAPVLKQNPKRKLVPSPLRLCHNNTIVVAPSMQCKTKGLTRRHKCAPCDVRSSRLAWLHPRAASAERKPSPAYRGLGRSGRVRPLPDASPSPP